MEGLFKEANYKILLKNYVDGPDAPRGLRSELARAMGCQAAYLTQVLNGKAELTEEHALRLCRHLQLTKIESDYLILLVRLSRAASPELRSFLEEERQALILKHDDIRHRMRTNDAKKDSEFIEFYFSSWIPTTIHMATACEGTQTIDAIAQRLNLKKDTVTQTLHKLEKYSFVKRAENKWTWSGMPLHLSRDSNLNIPYQLSHRLQMMKALQQDHREESIHFASTFTVEKKYYEQIRRLILEGVEKAHKVIADGGAEELYAMCIDLFRII